MGVPEVTWYAGHQRAVVTDRNGTKWWVAPGFPGEYSVVREDQGEVRVVPSMDDGLRSVLGDEAGPWLGVAR